MQKRLNFRKSWLIIAIFLSGFCFSALQVSLFRLLSFSTGTTVMASTVVLSGFMTGQGLGAAIIGRIKADSRKITRLLFTIFILLAFVAASYSFILNPSIATILAQKSVVSYLFITAIVIVPSTLIGVVFPAISFLYINTDLIASKLGKMYSADTIGAAIGGITAGIFLLAKAGQKGTFYIIAIMLLIIASLFAIIYFNIQNEGKTIERQSVKVDKSKMHLLVLSFVFGFVVLALEVLWLKYFKVYFTNTAYAFSLVTSMAILGIFAGSSFFEKYSSKRNNIISSKLLSNTVLVFLVVVIASIILVYNIPEWLLFPLERHVETNWVRVFLIPFLSSLVVIVPVSAVSGFAFPLITSLYHNEDKNVNNSVGAVLFANYLGSALGPIVAIFVLLKFFNLVNASILIMLIIAVAGIYLSVKSNKKFKYIYISVSLILFIILVANPTIRVLPPSFNKLNRKVLAYGETAEGIYVVGKDTKGNQSVLSTYVNNSAVIGSSYDAIKAVKMVGHLPFFVSENEIENVLVIGFGIGVTTSAIAEHSEVKQIQCVDLISELSKVAHFYEPLNHNVVRDKRLEIISGDGRRFLQATKNKYDLISCDPTHPILGSGNLYTREYYQQCFMHLTEKGIYSQYLPLHKITNEDLLGIIKTFYSVFDNASVWIAHNHAILLGNKDSGKIDFKKWTNNIAELKPDIYFYDNPYHLAACVFLESEKINAITSNSKINTDNKTYTEFFKLSSLNSDNLYKNISSLNDDRVSVFDVFSNIGDTATMNSFAIGNFYLTNGIIEMCKNNPQGYKENLYKANYLNPQNEEIPFLIKYYFN
ncbi:MAG: fused MFS/spermidine synthase [Bacteroidales bacterium]